MAVYATTGCKIYIGGQGVLASESSWVEIGEVSNLGEFGDVFENVTFQALSANRVKKTKGTANAGDISLEMGHDPDDLGQAALKSANDDTSSIAYNFKVEFTDAPNTPSGETPTLVTFKALVMGYRYNIGAANNTITVSSTLGITTALTVTAPSST